MNFNEFEIIEYLHELKKAGIIVSVNNNKLKVVDTKNSITSKIKSDIREKKNEILRIFQYNILDKTSIKSIRSEIQNCHYLLLKNGFGFLINMNITAAIIFQDLCD